MRYYSFLLPYSLALVNDLIFLLGDFWASGIFSLSLNFNKILIASLEYVSELIWSIFPGTKWVFQYVDSSFLLFLEIFSCVIVLNVSFAPCCVFLLRVPNYLCCFLSVSVSSIPFSQGIFSSFFISFSLFRLLSYLSSILLIKFLFESIPLSATCDLFFISEIILSFSSFSFLRSINSLFISSYFCLFLILAFEFLIQVGFYMLKCLLMMFNSVLSLMLHFSSALWSFGGSSFQSAEGFSLF